MIRTVRQSRRFARALTFAIIACSGQSPATTTDDTDSLITVLTGVVISADASSSATGDNYTIAGRPFIEGNSLHVTVQYGGGCRRHDFALLASHVFMESNPVQSAIAIRHAANGDLCKAWLTRELRFDLTALRDAWRRAYRQQNGTIILRLRGYSEGIAYQF
ncbi:MAG: hypothetical protein ACT4P7_21915 [Gemmatimonadaceae bacterium]